MADTKISALPTSTVPLAGTEVLPIVQSSTTKQVSVANLTAGRTFDALGMTLTSTDAAAAAAPLLELYRDSASPAASDTLGEIEFNGEDSAGNKQAYGLIHGSILSPTSTAEQGQLHFETATAGALTEKMIIGTTNLVINEIGAVFNVRIEGDTDANLFYSDATNSRVGIGTASPATKLQVVGDTAITSGNLLVGNTNIASTKLAVAFDGNTENGSIFRTTTDASGAAFAYFQQDTNICGYIARVGLTSAVVYVTSSDYRLKNNQTDLTGSGNFIDALKPKTWKWAKDGSTASGFIAHEFAEVSPTSVVGEKDAVDKEGNPVYQGMQASSSEVIANLVAEIQSLRKRLAALETKCL